jgi:hypothetical protein
MASTFKKLEEKERPQAQLQNLVWTLQNQFFLSKIFREKRDENRLRKNRIEKMRARNSTLAIPLAVG